MHLPHGAGVFHLRPSSCSEYETLRRAIAWDLLTLLIIFHMYNHICLIMSSIKAEEDKP